MRVCVGWRQIKSKTKINIKLCKMLTLQITFTLLLTFYLSPFWVKEKEGRMFYIQKSDQFQTKKLIS